MRAHGRLNRSLSRRLKLQSGSSLKYFRRAVPLLFLLLSALIVSYVLEYATSLVFAVTGVTEVDEVQDRGDLIRHEKVEEQGPPEYPTLANSAPIITGLWDSSKILQQIPVLFYYAKPGAPPCHPAHYAYKPVMQAARLNSLVHVIAAEECRHFYTGLGIGFEPFDQYEDVYRWFLRNIGHPVDQHVRWFIMKRFMERHDYPRAFYLATEVMLYANVTEMAAFLYPSSHIVLPVRWPSLRPPLRENQYPSTAVAGHAALFSYEGLADWCLFLHKVFQVALFGGDKQQRQLVHMPQYTDMLPMGWYTFAECWLEDLDPPCLAEKGTGITPQRAALLRGQFTPRYTVESFCMPRMCRNSTWSSLGPCVFDNNFSITTSTVYFRFNPRAGDKVPTSRNYAFYEAWTKRQQRRPVQFLAVHFEGKKKEFLTMQDDDPSHSWGGSSE